MPTYVVTDWVNGPMGPGWFVMFPRHRDAWYDGGPMDWKKEEKRDDIEELDAEILALILMLRCRC